MCEQHVLLDVTYAHILSLEHDMPSQESQAEITYRRVALLTERCLQIFRCRPSMSFVVLGLPSLVYTNESAGAISHGTQTT